METESQAKIAIRGKGSVKEGKGRSDAAHTSNQEEDLHCLIMADTEEKIERAKAAIHRVIETVSSRLFNYEPAPPFTDESNRLRLSQRVRMNSNEINFESWLLSTGLFVMTKTKLARTAVKLDTVNTTVQNSVTLLPI